MELSPASAPPRSDARFYVFNAVVTAVALSFLAWLLYVRKAGGVDADLRFLPGVNACLNAVAATFLVSGYLAIRRGRRTLHKYFMVSALASSALFFVSYVAYHYAHGDTKYQGTGPMRAVYLVILASHVLLSLGVLPLALSSVYFAARGAFARHKKVTRWALPIWLYVSVTGVVIYFMLRGSAPAVP